ncbi:hypothetical protein ACFLU6_09995 [Acidobacteriota bacterium]
MGKIAKTSAGRILILLVFAWFSCALLIGTGGRALAFTLTPTEIHDAQQPVFALAVGEIDPGHDGLELVFLTQDGKVHQLTRETDGWTATFVVGAVRRIGDPKDQSTLEIGDVHSGYDGNEIVASGGNIVVVAFRDPASGWSAETLWDGDVIMGFSWGAHVGDADVSHPKDEILFIHEGTGDRSVGYLYREVGGAWVDEMIFNAEVGLDSAIGEFDSNHDGPEICLVTEMGPAYELMPGTPPDPGEWPKQTIWSDGDNAAWKVLIADADPSLPGAELLYGTRYTDSIMMSWPDGLGGHQVRVLFTGPMVNDEMWNVAAGQVLTDSPTLEILGVDDSSSLFLVRFESGNWLGEIAWTDTSGALYAVVTGDFLSEALGDEIAVAGRSGKITLLARDDAIPSSRIHRRTIPVVGAGWKTSALPLTSLNDDENPSFPIEAVAPGTYLDDLVPDSPMVLYRYLLPGDQPASGTRLKVTSIPVGLELHLEVY